MSANPTPSVDSRPNLHPFENLIVMQMLHNSGVGGPRAAASLRFRELEPLKKVFDENLQKDWDVIDKALRLP